MKARKNKSADSVKNRSNVKYKIPFPKNTLPSTLKNYLKKITSKKRIFSKHHKKSITDKYLKVKQFDPAIINTSTLTLTQKQKGSCKNEKELQVCKQKCESVNGSVTTPKIEKVVQVYNQDIVLMNKSAVQPTNNSLNTDETTEPKNDIKSLNTSAAQQISNKTNAVNCESSTVSKGSAMVRHMEKNEKPFINSRSSDSAVPQTISKNIDPLNQQLELYSCQNFPKIKGSMYYLCAIKCDKRKENQTICDNTLFLTFPCILYHCNDK